MMTAAVLSLLLGFFLRPAVKTVVMADTAPTPRARDLEGVGEGFTPRQTPPPHAGQHSVAPLEKRQTTGTLCGYESGNILSSLTCASGRRCLTTRTGDDDGQWACCHNTVQCSFVTSCRDLTAGCDAVCMANTRVQWCLHPDYPYCNTYTHSDLRLTNIACNASPTRRPIDVQLTFGPARPPTSPPVRSPTGPIITHPAPTATPIPTKASVPVGAIVGGVLGGLALIAGIVLAICVFVYLRHRGRRQNNNNNAADVATPFEQSQQQPVMSYNAQPPPPPPPPQLQPTYLAPVPGAAMSPPLQQQQQQPQAQPADGKFGGAAANYGDGSGGAGSPGKHLFAAGLPPYHQGGYEMHPQHSSVGSGGGGGGGDGAGATAQTQAPGSPATLAPRAPPIGPAHPPWHVYEVPDHLNTK